MEGYCGFCGTAVGLMGTCECLPFVVDDYLCPCCGTQFRTEWDSPLCPRQPGCDRCNEQDEDEIRKYYPAPFGPAREWIFLSHAAIARFEWPTCPPAGPLV